MEHQNNMYQPPTPPTPTYQPQDGDSAVMSTKDWLITLLIMMIPCVNLVMMFVWAFGQGNLNRRNYFRAYLIMAGIGIAIWLVLVLIFGTVVFTTFTSW